MIVWHVCISGFRQNAGRVNGVLRLWRERIRLLTDGDTYTCYRPWDSDWRELASFINLTREPGRPLRVGIYGFSYGAGWGAMQLARALRRSALSVDAMVLADPVYRHGLRSLAWLSLVRCPVIRVPSNVRWVRYLLQRETIPRGHRLIASEGAGTVIERPRIVRLPHIAMDDYLGWHELAEETAYGLHAR